MEPEHEKAEELGASTPDDEPGTPDVGKRAGRGVTVGELAAQIAASHGPILKSAGNLAGLHAPVDALSTSIGKSAASGFGLTVGNLASAYLAREMAQGRLDFGKIAVGIPGIEKLNLGAFVQVGLSQTKINIGALSAAAAGGLTADVIGQWRDTLAIGKKGAQAEVAGAISRLIADNNINRLALAGMPPGLTGETLGKRISEIAGAYFTGVGQDLRDGIIGSLRPAALAASRALMERIKASSETERRHEEALWRLGWWMPPSASMEFFWEVGALADEGLRHELRRAMTEAARSREFGRIVESWMDLPSFQNRRRFIRDGLQDHRRGRYRVSIPFMLTLLEGIAIEAFTPRSTDTHPRAAIRFAAETLDTVMGSAMVETVTIGGNLPAEAKSGTIAFTVRGGQIVVTIPDGVADPHVIPAGRHVFSYRPDVDLTIGKEVVLFLNRVALDGLYADGGTTYGYRYVWMPAHDLYYKFGVEAGGLTNQGFSAATEAGMDTVKDAARSAGFGTAAGPTGDDAIHRQDQAHQKAP